MKKKDKKDMKIEDKMEVINQREEIIRANKEGGKKIIIRGNNKKEKQKKSHNKNKINKRNMLPNINLSKQLQLNRIILKKELKEKRKNKLHQIDMDVEEERIIINEVEAEEAMVEEPVKNSSEVVLVVVEKVEEEEVELIEMTIRDRMMIMIVFILLAILSKDKTLIITMKIEKKKEGQINRE